MLKSILQLRIMLESCGEEVSGIEQELNQSVTGDPQSTTVPLAWLQATHPSQQLCLSVCWPPHRLFHIAQNVSRCRDPISPEHKPLAPYHLLYSHSRGPSRQHLAVALVPNIPQRSHLEQHSPCKLQHMGCRGAIIVSSTSRTWVFCPQRPNSQL